MADWIPYPTQDGSFTFLSPDFGEAFHSSQGAKTEALQKFVAATDLPQKAQQSPLKILDVCYGLGYNTAAALETLRRLNPTGVLEIQGLELDPTVPLGAATPELLTIWSEDVAVLLQALARHHTWEQEGLKAYLWIGDARQSIQRLIQEGFKADAIFLDPFSPRRCPQLWTVEFLTAVAQCLAPNGKLATYSRSAAVRTALLAAGLSIGTLPLSSSEPHQRHEWSQGTVAAWHPQTLHPLSQMEQEHLQTRAAIPYHDPTLTAIAADILAQHQAEQQQSLRESTSSWRRRWGIR